jgi:hypothetical protein
MKAVPRSQASLSTGSTYLAEPMERGDEAGESLSVAMHNATGSPNECQVGHVVIIYQHRSQMANSWMK